MPEIATDEELHKVLEALLFITDRPLALAEIAKVVGVKPERAEPLLKQIQKEYDENGRPEQVLEIAEGYQMATRQEFAPFVRKLYADRLSFRLSQAALETLSIIAYKQPITRAEIEDLRGVEVIAALETLLEKRLVKVVGRKEVVGRPLLYGTTLEFLRHFGLKSLEELPNLDSLTPVPAATPAPVIPPMAESDFRIDERTPAPVAEAPSPAEAGEVDTTEGRAGEGESEAPVDVVAETPVEEDPEVIEEKPEEPA